MKVLWSKMFSCLCVLVVLMMLADMTLTLYVRFVGASVYNASYLETIDATCIETMFNGKPVMYCMDGDRIKVTP